MVCFEISFIFDRYVCLFVCSNYYLLYRLTPSFFSSILSARSPFTDAEYCRVMRIVEALPDEGKRLFCSAVLRYQLHMGARVDDTAKLSKANIKANPDAALDKLSLITKLCWSKNIQEENQGMYYIVVDSNYYLLLLSSNSFFLCFST